MSDPVPVSTEGDAAGAATGGPLNRIDGRLVALVGRANQWLASRFATHPGVWLVAPPAPVVTTADPARRWVYHYDERTLRFLGLQIHPSCLP